MEKNLTSLSRLIRYWILTSTSHAGSGHPTSSLSAVELMTDLFFGGILRFAADTPEHPNNDRVIFSKGHASPLLYSLWAAAGQLSEQDLRTYRQFGSELEGHPTSRFAWAGAATGSLGQGLPIGLGMALNAKYVDRLPYRTYVLLGDSEMSEGSQWEAIQLAKHYELDNLVGIVDVNRFGQRGETMYGHDLQAYRDRVAAFGWATFLVEDGHNHQEVLAAYRAALKVEGRPSMVIAATEKGKGVSFIEGEGTKHGKSFSADELDRALKELGEVDRSLTGQIASPERASPEGNAPQAVEPPEYAAGASVATRDAYGNALTRLAPKYPSLIALDGEVSNSTRAKFFRDAYRDRFFEMYIAEQNMVGAGLGLALRGKMPFVSTFAAFLTRAFDQIRMSQYSTPNMKFVGSHAGVSIGQDGPSQMGLEDIAMFRTLVDGVVLYPSDAMSTERLVEAMAEHDGMAYLRTTRGATPVLYGPDEVFPIGGSKVLRSTDDDDVTLVAAGITVPEALEAHDQLEKAGINARVIDLYSIKPIDLDTLREAADSTGLLLTVEDHYVEGGLGEAVCAAVSEHPVPVYRLAVRERPRSGDPARLLKHHGISAQAIVEAVKQRRRAA